MTWVEFVTQEKAIICMKWDPIIELRMKNSLQNWFMCTCLLENVLCISIMCVISSLSNFRSSQITWFFFSSIFYILFNSSIFIFIWKILFRILCCKIYASFYTMSSLLILKEKWIFFLSSSSQIQKISQFKRKVNTEHNNKD